MRLCTICGCDISGLHYNRRRCHNPDCLRKQREMDNAKRTKSTASPFTKQNKPRALCGVVRCDVQPYQLVTPRTIRGSGGTNLTPDVCEEMRKEEWARLTKGRKV